MTDDSNPAKESGQHPGAAPGPAVVPLGNKMAVTAPKAAGAGAAATPDGAKPHTEIANGVSFVGNAVLSGACMVKGKVQGNLKQAAGAKIAVVVSESGYVKGDIVADQISVMGRTEGTLDASGGSVALHDSASVSGHVRYSRIQVNGSDLNATLERSPPAHGQAKAQAPDPARPVPRQDPLPELKFPAGSVPGDAAGVKP